jgi:integrase
MVLLAFKHGRRASELVDLRWEQVDLENAILHVRRAKNGSPATHPLTGRTCERCGVCSGKTRLRRSSAGTPFAVRGFQNMVERAGIAAGSR